MVASPDSLRPSPSSEPSLALSDTLAASSVAQSAVASDLKIMLFQNVGGGRKAIRNRLFLSNVHAFITHCNVLHSCNNNDNRHILVSCLEYFGLMIHFTGQETPLFDCFQHLLFVFASLLACRGTYTSSRLTKLLSRIAVEL